MKMFKKCDTKKSDLTRVMTDMTVKSGSIDVTLTNDVYFHTSFLTQTITIQCYSFLAEKKNTLPTEKRGKKLEIAQLHNNAL